MNLAPSDWITIAQIAGAIAMLLVLKPISDLKRDLTSFKEELGETKTMLYREFVTHERLNERFDERDEARIRQNKVRSARASRNKNIARKSS